MVVSLLSALLSFILCSVSHTHNILNDNQLKVSEISALQDLYDVTGGIDWNWKNVSIYGEVWNFTSTSDPCLDKWQGITCSQATDASLIVGIDLQQYNMSGTIPSSMKNFTQLVWLRFSRNNLTGEVPDSIGNLNFLTELDFSYNRLEGSLPLSLSNLSSLTDLSLAYNNFHGPLPSIYSCLSVLESLMLEFNQLTGNIEDFDFSATPHMTDILLHNNHFTGTVPESLSQLTTLSTVFLDHNAFSGPLPVPCSSNATIQVMVYDVNYFTGSLPECMGAMREMVSLVLVGNFITGELPSALSQMTDLSYLILDSNLFSGTLPALNKFPYMTFLFLQTNLFTGGLSQLVDSSTQSLMTYIDVSMNQFTGQIPPDIFNLKTLQSFAAATNCLSGSISADMCGLANLEFLDLDGMNTASSCQYQFFPYSDTVFHSYMLTTPIKGPIPSCLFAMPNLTTLHLSGNAIQSTLPADLTVSDSLADLSLSHNRLSGTIPLVIQQRVWSNLDLSYNKLTGVLDSAIVVDQTTTLSLQVNRLSGRIPSALVSLGSINILDGNLFSCNPLTRSELPVHDQDFETYQCGSNSFNQSMAAWWVLAFVLSLGALIIFIVASRYNVSRYGNSVIAYCVRVNKQYNQAMAVFDAQQYYNDRSSDTHNDNSSSGTASVMRGVVVFGAFLFTLRRTLLCLTLFILAVSLPIYCALTQYYSTLDHEYAWVVSIAFLAGVAPAVILLVMFAVFTSLVVWLWWRKLGAVKPESGGLSSVTQAASSTRSTPVNYRRYFSLFLLTFFNCSLVLVVNGVYVYIVLTYNTSTVITTQVVVALFKLVWNDFAVRRMMARARQYYQTTSENKEALTSSSGRQQQRQPLLTKEDLAERETFSFALADRDTFSMADPLADRDTFSLSEPLLLFGGRESIILDEVNKEQQPMVGDTCTDSSVDGNKDEQVSDATNDVKYITIIILFNSIVAPCLATAAVSPSCFRNVLIAPPQVTSSFPFAACLETSGEMYQQACNDFKDAFLHTSYSPPFIYSYQCSSAFVTSYSEVFVYMFLFLAFIKPPLMLLLQKVAERSIERREGWVFRLSNAALMPLMKCGASSVPVELSTAAAAGSGSLGAKEDGVAAPSSAGVLFETEKFTMQVIGTIGVFLTFGVVLPPLAVVTLVALYSHTYFHQYALGRYLVVKNTTSPGGTNTRVAAQLSAECRSVPVSLKYAVRILVPFIVLFYSLFVFDIAGDTVGWQRAMWLPISMYLVSIAAYATYFCWRKYRRSGRDGGNGGGGGHKQSQQRNAAGTGASSHSNRIGVRNSAAEVERMSYEI